MDRSSFRLDDIEKTWIFDLDGTLVVHNGYKNGVDELLSGVKEFYEKNINDTDYILIITEEIQSSRVLQRNVCLTIIFAMIE